MFDMKEQNKIMEKNFSVFCLTGLDSPSKIMYSHWSDNLKMVIKKDGQVIELNSEEIQKLVKSLPRTIGGSY